MSCGESVAQLKQITYQRMDIRPGHHVLDVGCGPATDTIPLAALVSASGKTVGVDYDAHMAFFYLTLSARVCRLGFARIFLVPHMLRQSTVDIPRL